MNFFLSMILKTPYWLLVVDVVILGIFLGLILRWIIINRNIIISKYWLFRYPQLVYNARFHFPNKQFIDWFVKVDDDSFIYDGGKYYIQKEAIKYKKRGNTARFNGEKVSIIGHIDYLINHPTPVIFKDHDDIVKNESNELFKTNSKDLLKTEDNYLLYNLLMAEFSDKMFKLIIIIVIINLIGTLLLVSWLMGWVEITPKVVLMGVGGS